MTATDWMESRREIRRSTTILTLPPQMVLTITVTAKYTYARRISQRSWGITLKRLVRRHVVKPAHWLEMLNLSHTEDRGIGFHDEGAALRNIASSHPPRQLTSWPSQR